VQQREYKKALEVLQTEGKKSAELYYKFSPALMATVPHLTVQAWIKAGDALEPRKLIPALMRYDYANSNHADKDDVPQKYMGANQAVRYLLDCVKRANTDEAIHNYLISVLAAGEEEEALLRFLSKKSQARAAGEGGEAAQTGYDMKYALRQCIAAGKEKCVVYLYGELGLHEEVQKRSTAYKDPCYEFLKYSSYRDLCC